MGVIDRAHPDIQDLLHIPYVFPVKLCIKVVDFDCLLLVDDAWRLKRISFGIKSSRDKAHSSPDLAWDFGEIVAVYMIGIRYHIISHPVLNWIVTMLVREKMEDNGYLVCLRIFHQRCGIFRTDFHRIRIVFTLVCEHIASYIVSLTRCQMYEGKAVPDHRPILVPVPALDSGIIRIIEYIQIVRSIWLSIVC